MFRIKYPVGARIKGIFQGCLKPIDEVPMSVDSERFLIRALSPDKNLLVEVSIPQSAFESFDVSRKTTLAVDKVQLLRSLRRVSKKDTILMEFEEVNRTFKLVLINAKTGIERNYLIDVREVGTELVGSINIDLPVRFQIPSEDFRKIVSDAKLVNEDLELTYEDDRVIASSTSENRMFRQTLALDRPLYSLEAKESKVASKYDLDILKTLVNSLTLADVTTVEFGPSLPIKISVEVGDGSKVTYWVASKV
ncbi:MAG: hypothetical protein RMH77_06605 [Sulfolobales archaeon]|nr:hypothetical protein [Sulfolobales archaeon]MCX8185743.1 hypothetical protein [Sulfolobales archaeon]MDW7970049.1 hypothetical protein [Sulfolobales archaeon]